jgi:hypothetical protein
MEDDDASSSDLDVDHEERGSSHAQRRTRDHLGGRRGASFDLRDYQRDVVSHQNSTRIPTPSHFPSAEDTPNGSPVSSTASLSTPQLAPPPDHGSPPPTNSLLRVQSDTSPVQRDHRFTISGPRSVSASSPPASRRRTSQVLEDFWRGLRSDPNTPSIRTTPPQVDTGALASSALSPLNELRRQLSPSRSPAESNDETRSRRNKSRFRLSAISDAILDSVRSRSPLSAKRRAEGASVGLDPNDGDKTGETSRGRSREKGKGVTRDLSQALIKVSEVFGLEPEDGRESRDRWKEFKKGSSIQSLSLRI